jgi:hypothetical protein
MKIYVGWDMPPCSFVDNHHVSGGPSASVFRTQDGSYMALHDGRFPETASLIFRIRTVRKEYYDLHDNSVAAVGNRRGGAASGNITGFRILNYSYSQHACKCSFCEAEHRQKTAILGYPLTLQMNSPWKKLKSQEGSGSVGENDGTRTQAKICSRVLFAENLTLRTKLLLETKCAYLANSNSQTTK